jgi:hypothetical protein
VSLIQRRCPHFTGQFALRTAVWDQMRCPYSTGCPHFAGLLFTGFTVQLGWWRLTCYSVLRWHQLSTCSVFCRRLLSVDQPILLRQWRGRLGAAFRCGRLGAPGCALLRPGFGARLRPGPGASARAGFAGHVVSFSF